jgi:hypothetical protein
MEAYAAISALLVSVLGLFLVVALPVYCARQDPAGPFWKGYLWGGVLGAGLGVVMLSAMSGPVSGSASYGVGLARLVVGLVIGAAWGAYLGVALAGLFVGPIPRQMGTQWGAAVGLGVALLLGAVAAWRGSHHTPTGSERLAGEVVAVLLGGSAIMALGGMIGSQVGLWRDPSRPASARSARRLPADLLKLLALCAVLPPVLSLLDVAVGKLEAPGRAREAQAKEAAQRFPGNAQSLHDLASRDPQARARAAQELGNPLTAGGDPRVLPALLRATRDDSAAVRASAAQSLGSLRAARVQQQPGGPDDPRAVDALAKLLRDPEAYVRLQAVLALAQVGSPRVVALLREAESDPDPKVRAAATAMAGQFQGKPAAGRR